MHCGQFPGKPAGPLINAPALLRLPCAYISGQRAPGRAGSPGPPLLCLQAACFQLHSSQNLFVPVEPFAYRAAAGSQPEIRAGLGLGQRWRKPPAAAAQRYGHLHPLSSPGKSTGLGAEQGPAARTPPHQSWPLHCTAPTRGAKATVHAGPGAKSAAASSSLLSQCTLHPQPSGRIRAPHWTLFHPQLFFKMGTLGRADANAWDRYLCF